MAWEFKMAYNRTLELLSAKLIMVALPYNRNENTTEVQKAFRATFPDRDPPHKATILRNELRQQPDFVRRLDEPRVRAMLKRAELCVERNGGHVEGHGP